MELNKLLLPTDPLDDRNIFLEIRAGTGGDEAAIFAGDLFRMYSRYAEQQRWQVEVISESHGEHGGYKEIIVRLIGQGVYSRLKFESGAHRVQRVPETEAQGRIHTSAATVAVLPEVEEVDAHRHQSRRSARSTLTAPPAPAASTSTRPIRRYASPTFPAASWWNARTNAHNTRTAPAPCRC